VPNILLVHNVATFNLRLDSMALCFRLVDFALINAARYFTSTKPWTEH